MSEIQVQINGEKEKVENDVTLKEILEEKEVNTEAAVVKVNDETIEKNDIEEVIINENDEIEYIYFMGGGK